MNHSPGPRLHIEFVRAQRSLVMEKEKDQNFQNHARVVPPFHFFVLPVLLINVIYSLVRLKDGFTFYSIWSVVLAIALLMLALLGRIATLSVQDRIIRLEMQVRLEGLPPLELRARIPEFTVEQLVALRFASDEELPV